ncbi:hypothetical protein BH11PLA2_BH11PLA2_04940 [soil metagenome]
MDFTPDDLFDAIDRIVRDLLDRVNVTQPPINALGLAHDVFGFEIDYQTGHNEEPQYGDKPRRKPGGNTIVIKDDQSEESQHNMAARSIAKRLVPDVLAKLGVIPGTENRSALNTLLAPITSRLLLPTRWFTTDCRQLGWDLAALKDKYTSAGFEMLAWRMLEMDDEASVITILDDGAVTQRRGNRFSVTRKLEVAEETAVAKAQDTKDPATVRKDGWTATAWPTRGVPFRRIIVRSVPDLL